jgi:hypothetical protein
VFWAGTPQRFREAVESLELLKPGFCSRYGIYAYEDLAFLPEAALRKFNQLMSNIGRCSSLLDQAGVPTRDSSGRKLNILGRLTGAGYK